jgi:isopentenyl diphosphate isomerase/L-lactate dehydrogenase-like FMN-dependent dehydrogenase
VSDVPRFVTLDDFEPEARAVLAPDVYDYFAGGAGEEWTMAENRRAFDRWVLRPRVLRGAAMPDPSVTVLGASLSFPVLVAPWAFQGLAHADGEVGTARAAAAEGSLMVVSSTAEAQLSEIAAASAGPKWWQLYVFTDRGRTRDMLQRAAANGYSAVMWTVDTPVLGVRHRDTRSGFELPVGVHGDLVIDPSLTWDDLAWIREASGGLPVLVKGVLTAEDAREAVAQGVDGVVVSNHGGRQLDGSPATLDALPEVVAAVRGAVPVLVDGGVRRGSDVVKALALGASAVMIGRPAVWALAAGGSDGVALALRMLRNEVGNAMSIAGCRTVADIDGGLVAPAPR